MVSFSCEACGDVLTKKKLDAHRNQCRGASYTCLDCMVHFHGTDYRSHTSCITEAQKYQGHLYREKENKKANKGEKRKSVGSQYSSAYDNAMVPRKAYVEDAPDEGENAVAIVDVPPRAPTPPPPSEALPEPVNVFDFLLSGDDKPKESKSRKTVQAPEESKMITDSQYSQYSQFSNGDGNNLVSHGFSYGNAPIEPGFERFDSWPHLTESQASALQHNSQMAPPPPYLTKIVTPGPDRERKRTKDDKSDKKRKRHHVDDLDLSVSKRPASRDEPMTDAPPTRILHSGLTGGLTRLVTDSSFYEDRIDAGPTPISPIKRSKRDKSAHEVDSRRRSSYTTSRASTSTQPLYEREERRAKRRESSYYDDQSRSSRRARSPSSSSNEHRPSARHLSRVKAIEFQPHSSRQSSVQPSASNQLVAYRSRAELFMSFVTKGPDSERGCSINKALKRYHRERSVRGEEKDDENKELWKSLRMRRNDRGEIVLFIS